MFQRPPRERERLSWLYVATWTAIIFLTVPFVRVAVDYIGATWGREVFTYAVAAILVTGFVVTMIYLVRRPDIGLVNYASLLAVVGLLVYQTFELGSGSPEEAVHYVEYGVLSLLIYRAFTHRIDDISIYLASTIVGSLVGMIDETIQWLSPGRHFDFADIFLNFTAVGLVQVAIAAGLRPSFIRGWPSAANLSLVCRLAAVPVAYLGLCYLNTPAHVAWYSAHVPMPGFVTDNTESMVEYGYLHKDPEVGIFRSRLTVDEIREQAAARALEGAEILDRFRPHERYAEFLETYTAPRDPLLHEARVHLFRRDVYLRRGDNEESEDQRPQKYAVAYWENRILEKYFGPLLNASSYVWPPDIKLKVEPHALLQEPYESAVGARLLTQIGVWQTLWIFIPALAALIVLGRYFGKRARESAQARHRALRGGEA